MDDVPPEGTMVKLTLTGNMSTGGISIDRTFEAHPENVEIAEEAARVVGLDIAGIDFICPDITEPVRETGGAICEVNAAPGFRMHTHPTIGDPQFIAKPVVDMLFPPGAPSRIPIVAVTGTNGKTTTVADDRAHLQGHGPQGRHDVDRRHRHRRAAGDPRRRVRTEVGPDGAAEPAGRLRGLRGRSRRHPARGARLRAQRRRRGPQRRSPTTSGMRGIDTRRAARRREGGRRSRRCRATATRCSTPTTRWCGRCAAAAPARSCGSAWSPSGSEVRDFIDDHCRRGGRAVVLERSELGDMIVIRHGPRAMQLAWTHLLPATFGGRALMNVQNSLAAAAAAFAAGAPLHDIRQGLRTFSTYYYLSPGRLNEIEVEGVTRHRRLLPQRARHADARRLRRPARREAHAASATSPSRRGSASSPPPATGATRTCSSSARSRPTTST